MTNETSCYLFCYTSSQKGTRVLYCIFARFETGKQTIKIMWNKTSVYYSD